MALVRGDRLAWLAEVTTNYSGKERVGEVSILLLLQTRPSRRASVGGLLGWLDMTGLSAPGNSETFGGAPTLLLWVDFECWANGGLFFGKDLATGGLMAD